MDCLYTYLFSSVYVWQLHSKYQMLTQSQLCFSATDTEIECKITLTISNAFISSNGLENKTKQINTSSSSYHLCRCRFSVMCYYHSCQVNTLADEVRISQASFFRPPCKAVFLTRKLSQRLLVYRGHVPHEPLLCFSLPGTEHMFLMLTLPHL